MSRVSHLPTLKEFMTRRKVLSLYRDIMRAVLRLEPTDRQFVHEWARADFERHRHETDQEKILSLLSQGKVQFRTLENSMTLSKRRF
jgi:Complex 1 protein (LYR family)